MLINQNISLSRKMTHSHMVEGQQTKQAGRKLATSIQHASMALSVIYQSTDLHSMKLSTTCHYVFCVLLQRTQNTNYRVPRIPCALTVTGSNHRHVN